MIALWEKPHRLLVKSEPTTLGCGHEFRAQTPTNGCRCKDLVAAVVLGSISLEVNVGNIESGIKLNRASAWLKLGAMDVKFCPFCGKSVKLLLPRVDWISKDREKTRL